jgi:hypothetical protein
MRSDRPERHAQPRERAATLDRFAWTVALALVALHIGVAWLARAPTYYSDGAVYVALARSLRDFEYRELFHVGQPLHRMYPPGYPLVLALWAAAGGESFDWLVVVSIACSSVALLLIFAVVRRRWGAFVALTSLAAMACNAELTRSAGLIMSEAVFMLCLAAALWAASRDGEPRRNAVLAGVMALAAAATRTIGITVVIAVVCHWLYQRRYVRAAALGLASAILVGGWIAFTAMAPIQVPGASYLADATVRPPNVSFGSALVARIGTNGRALAGSYGMMAPSVAGTPIDNVLAVVIIGVSGLAGGLALCRRWPAAASHLAAYVGGLLLWPWLPSRFVVPVLPWIITAIVIGFHRLASVVPAAVRIIVTLALTGAMAVTGLTRAAVLIRERADCDRTAMPTHSCGGAMFERLRQYFAVVRWVRDFSKPDAVVVTPYAATMYLFSGRQALPMPEALSRLPSEFVGFLRAHGAEYVVLTSLTAFTEGKPRVGGTPLAVMVRDNCRAFRLEAATDGSAYLFRLAAPDEAPSTGACQAADAFIARFGSERR